MRILAICNTYYQLIALIQIHLTIGATDIIDVLLSDHSKNAASISDRLEQLRFFNKVSLLKSKKLIYHSKCGLEKVKEIIEAVTGKSKICQSIEQEKYDQLLFFNADIATATIFAKLRQNNSKLQCARIEEGIASYDKNDLINPLFPVSGRLHVVHAILKVLRKKNMNDCTKILYCYYPHYYRGMLSTVKIPLIDQKDGKLKQILAEIFSLDINKLSYTQKYIYFASMGDTEGGKPIGEVKLATRLAELVGKENLLIKVHPRDATEAFAKEGLNVDTNSALPWEIIQLNYDFTKHIFLTAISGSVLTISLVEKNHPQIYFLYPLCDFSKNSNLKAVKGLEGFFEKNLDKNIVVVDALEKILQ